MPLTHPIENVPRLSRQREPFIHLIAREFQWLLRALCILSLIATVVMMTTFWFWAIVPAVFLLLCYTLLIVTDAVEHQTDDGVDRSRAPVSAPTDPVELARLQKSNATTKAVEQRITRIALEVLAGALILGTTLGLTLFGWKLLPVALLVIGGYTILVTTPVWLAWMEKDMQEEVARRQ